MNYPRLKKLLFKLPPEFAHSLSLNALKLTSLLSSKHYHSTPKTIMGLEFPNSVGLAAGLDKNGDYIDALASLGFGFIEVGTATPKPQSGNPKPRLFRLEEDNAIINRMGFNNKGIDYLVGQVKKCHYRGILGINIGKNSTTANSDATQDYCYCLKKAYPYASYITINISSPNTPGLRNLQHESELTSLLDAIKQTQHSLQQQHNKYVPIAIKIAPDMDRTELASTANYLSNYQVDAVIATNTTLDRSQLNATHAKEKGGLSGKPLTNLSLDTTKQLRQTLVKSIPIIASGGIMCDKDAKERIDAGADLIQLYTGLIYQGPALIRDCHKLIMREEL